MTKHCFCLLLMLILILANAVFAAATSGAGYQNQVPARTNINEVTDFFSIELKDRADLDATHKDAQSSARAGIESGTSASETEKGLNLEDNINARADELSSIPAHDLESRGLQSRNTDCAFYDNERLEIDYNEPLVKHHKNDVNQILSGCNDFLTNLLSGLSSIGIDCKTVAGNKEQEPEYNVYKILEPHKDTVYDQKFCEQPHHTYSCNYILSSTCIRPSTAYRDWENKQIIVPGRELISAGKFVFETYKPRKKVFEYVLNLHPRVKHKWFIGRSYTVYPDPVKVRAMKEFLATKHNRATIDNISDEMEGKVQGETFSVEGWYYCGSRLGSKDYIFDSYLINYKYRTSYPVCLQWQDKWEELCKVD